MCTYFFDTPNRGIAYCDPVADQGGLGVATYIEHSELDKRDGSLTSTTITLCPLAFSSARGQDTLQSHPIRAKTKLAAVQPKKLDHPTQDFSRAFY